MGDSMGKVCVFFGNRDTPESVKPLLHDTLVDLIENEGINEFLVGNQGKFDFYVISELKKLSENYPEIKYTVMLAYMPVNDDKSDYGNTEYPAELAAVPRRFAIDKRNRLMINRADIAVTYISHIGGASKYKEICERKSKKVIELYIK